MPKITVSLAHGNVARRRRLAEQRSDAITGDHLSQQPPRVVGRVRGDALKRGNKFAKRDVLLGQNREPEQSADDDLPDDVQSVTENTGEPVAKVIKPKASKALTDHELSTSADVIFNPATQSTRYSSRTMIKRNLERRMPGFTAHVYDVFGEGQVDVSLACEMQVGDGLACVEARCIASTMDMAIRNIHIRADGRSFKVRPVDRAFSPEDADMFIRRITSNCLSRGAA